MATYKPETLKKYMKQANELTYAYSMQAVEEIKLCITMGNKKIGRVMNVSLPPIITCPHCAECMKICYDIKACLQYPKNVLDARIRNLAILKKSRDEYFARIDSAMSRRRKNKYFRWHVGGDIPDKDYFSRMVENARKHSDFVIWTYTKNYEAVNEFVAENGGCMKAAIPENLHIMFSEWYGLPMNNPYNFPEFACELNDVSFPTEWYEKHAYICPGNCDTCKAAGRGCVAGESSRCKEH